jgi:hypothetical protein
MAAPTTKTFTQLVQGQAAAIQARAAGLLDFSVGAVLRALIEAVSGVVLWLQALILQVLALTRLATSPTDADADSFVADFFGPFADGTPATFSRLGFIGSQGSLTFARFSATGLAFVPVGSTVSTQDGAQRFIVLLDTNNASYRADLSPGTGGAYAMPNGVGSVTVAAQALTPGAASNVTIGAANTITSAIAGVDTVTNPSAFTNGQDAETTPAFINRFRRQILALREATPATILSYIIGIRPGVTALNIENIDGAA